MRALVANIEDVMREAAARWTLVAYFLLSSVFILVFASAVNLDIVNGALAGAKLFGKQVQMHDEVSIEKLVVGFESTFSGIIYVMSVFLAVFATAHLVPRLQEKGTIDLYLSRPVGRVRLLLSRYLAGLLLSATNVIYLLGSIWLIVIWKTHVVHVRFMMASVLILFVIATLLAFAFLIGVITSSTAVSIMGTYGMFLLALALAAHDRMAAVASSEWLATLIQTLYWIVPKTAELAVGVAAYVSGDTAPQITSKIAHTLNPSIFLSTGAFAVVCLFLASWLFSRKEF